MATSKLVSLTTALLSIATIAMPASPASAAKRVSGYDLPPQYVLDVLHAAAPPRPVLSPTRASALLVSWVQYAPMSQVAEPFRAARFDAMEEAVLGAEERLAEARRRAEDPSIASDATALQQRFAEFREAEAEVDRLYERWSELEAKL